MTDVESPSILAAAAVPLSGAAAVLGVFVADRVGVTIGGSLGAALDFLIFVGSLGFFPFVIGRLSTSWWYMAPTLLLTAIGIVIGVGWSADYSFRNEHIDRNLWPFEAFAGLIFGLPAVPGGFVLGQWVRKKSTTT